MMIPAPARAPMTQEGRAGDAGAAVGLGGRFERRHAGSHFDLPQALSFQRRVTFMAELLARRDPDPALGAKGISFFRMQQKTAAHTAITLPFVIFGLAMGALGHDLPPCSQVGTGIAAATRP